VCGFARYFDVGRGALGPDSSVIRCARGLDSSMPRCAQRRFEHRMVCARPFFHVRACPFRPIRASDGGQERVIRACDGVQRGPYVRDVPRSYTLRTLLITDSSASRCASGLIRAFHGVQKADFERSTACTCRVASFVERGADALSKTYPVSAVGTGAKTIAQLSHFCSQRVRGSSG
jgi:hypothetical protein